ncbi:MAG: hypothetical protein RR448_04575 [Niameybacter sp.]|uniref:hypothetical protein n=1 Tax=Niameybacter sp. TaxID=2033640 RepID=UPI002FC6CB75
MKDFTPRCGKRTLMVLAALVWMMAGMMIMAFMMTLSIVIRSTTFINPIYWAPFYIGLRTALFGGGVCFGIGWMKWNRNIEKSI